MQFIAVQKNTRQTPRKVRLVANQVKKLSLLKALDQLAVMDRKSTLVLLKTLKQAIANAKNNHGVSPDSLEIKELLVTDAARYRRFRAVSRGRAHNVVKRSCHIRVVLQQKAIVPEQEAVKTAEKAPEVVPATATPAAATEVKKTKAKKVTKQTK
jgi:large subunit ribosomal protein L22